DFRERVITVEQSKSGRIRHIPMNKLVRDVLRYLSDASPLGHVFKWHGAAIQRVTTSFRTALQNSGIPRCRFHDLRHTFATRLVLSGIDLVTVKELMGHADITTTMRYAHPSPDSKRRAVDSLCREESGRYVADGGNPEDGSNAQVVEKYGAPDTIRTCDTRFRKPAAGL
ncbi:MAG: site-specific integrase, partial [Candidatus Krumholzibacteriota bacterium]|nr:site-specific integrase [Candidatus Krumholzibacteriota bacterium]